MESSGLKISIEEAPNPKSLIRKPLNSGAKTFPQLVKGKNLALKPKESRAKEKGEDLPPQAPDTIFLQKSLEEKIPRFKFHLKKEKPS